MKCLILDDNNIIVDILDECLDYNSPYFQTHKNSKFLNIKNLDYPFCIGQNIITELINIICELKENKINILEERIELIEKILIDEIINSKTFGRYEEKVDVKFQQ